MSRILKDKNNLITLAYGNGHQGVDIIPDDHGLCDVIAHSDGVVVDARNDYAGENEKTGNSYGNFIKVKCSNGMCYLYAHLKKGTVTKNVGDAVVIGEVLGYMWKSGSSNGIHVHMEVFDAVGNKIDPTKYLVEDIVETVKDPFEGVSNEELARRVWAGEFGNNPGRKEKLGIRYTEVQALVDKGVGKPTPEPVPESKPIDPMISLKKGDRVLIIGPGNGSSNGNSNKAYGIGWEREILNVWENRMFPYQVGNASGTTGFYSAAALRRL